MGAHSTTDVDAVGVAETHVSVVFFTPERAYKLLKPVTTSFLDHSRPAARIEAVDREQQLNARLAPDVYLGTADIVEDGALVDRMLVMRRLPADRRLTALVGTDEFDPALRAIARSVAVFHAGLEPVSTPTLMATSEGLATLWESSFIDIEPVVASVIDRDEFEIVRTLARGYLAHHAAMFERRRSSGAIRDGHGDLTAEDIFVLADGPRILDCLAFDDDLRICDVLADIGFLVMDVHRLAGADAARRLMAYYAEFSGEHHPSTLAHHYVAYRAHVRAKVEVLRHEQGASGAAAAARGYHALARHHLERAKLRLVLVGGGPGSGKSTLAEAIARRTGWVVLDSDELRKDLVGVDHLERRDDPPGEGLYSDAMKQATYEALIDRAAALLAAGESVVLDASWNAAADRDRARVVASSAGAEFVELECRLDPDEARRRIAARRREGCSPSDARPEIVEHLAARHDPWPTATAIDTSAPVDRSTDRAVDVALMITAGQ